MIKLEALRVFVVVAEAGNIKDAAEIVGRTPSAVSMTLKQLEDELGGPLFQTDRKNSLTALGSILFDTAHLQLKSFDRGIRTVRAFAKSRIGSLTIASVPSVAAHLLPILLQKFLEDRPQVQVELFDMDSAQVRQMVETGTADIGFSGEPRISGSIGFTPLFKDRYKLLCSEKSGLTSLPRSILWDDLAHENLILNGSSEQIRAEAYIDIASRSLMTVHNTTSLFALVKASLGVTILPALSAFHTPDGISVLDIAETRNERVVGMLERKDGIKSPVAEAFKVLCLELFPAHLKSFGLQHIENAETYPLHRST
ncbi:LysR family transcriptional regulator [Pararhizobium qamdonense]|uniref:LysR family transcriptional regulator n=1 Tax=Pararhizobium qamdonense TaxID=3031126 RepID=UPI0023E10354|nr:LysR family transcriptional regulator [Pararhizobium qamdonense]